MIENTPKIGDRYLVTTDHWFLAPDGDSYRAVYGTIKGISSDTEMLEIKTNRHSSNWYLLIGNMVIAGCQIHYAIKTDSCSKSTSTHEIEYEGKLNVTDNQPSRVYFAD